MKTQTISVFIRFTWSNIFFTVCEELNNRRIPVLIRGINTIRYKYAQNNSTFQNSKRFAVSLALAVKEIRQDNERVLLIFKNLGVRFQRRKHTNAGLSKHRRIFVEAFALAKIPLTRILDSSAVPYNGCRTWKKRRRKKKYFNKEVNH